LLSSALFTETLLSELLSDQSKYPKVLSEVSFYSVIAVTLDTVELFLEILPFYLFVFLVSCLFLFIQQIFIKYLLLVRYFLGTRDLASDKADKF
jgi:hypothetical protein